MTVRDVISNSIDMEREKEKNSRLENCVNQYFTDKGKFIIDDLQSYQKPHDVYYKNMINYLRVSMHSCDDPTKRTSIDCTSLKNEQKFKELFPVGSLVSVYKNKEFPRYSFVYKTINGVERDPLSRSELLVNFAKWQTYDEKTLDRINIQTTGARSKWGGAPRKIPILKAGSKDHPMNFADIHAIRKNITLEEAKEIAKDPGVCGFVRMRDQISLKSTKSDPAKFPFHNTPHANLVMFMPGGFMGEGHVATLKPGDFVFLAKENVDWLSPLQKHGDVFYNLR